ncbi:MAG: DNA polymerase II small subunit, partial [Candidatus Korarchaeota archaeon]|nr:DNA polymerase II small subunit [Candidatus Korarchaeota archaeon]
LRLRHLAPIYGEHPIAPGSEDWLLVDQIRRVLHVGHIHVYGVGEYNGVKIVNSGTFENETPYIKSLGIEVTVGKAPILNLKSMEIEVKDFSS